MDASKPSRRATTLSAMQERILQAIFPVEDDGRLCQQAVH